MSSGKPGLTKERKAWLASLSTLAAGAPHDKGRTAGTVALTAAQLGTLQGFPRGFDFRGTQRQVAAAIGNSIPPPARARGARKACFRPQE